MEKKVVVIQVRGGVIEWVSSNDENIGYVLIDWDNIKEGDSYPTKDEVYNMDYIFDDFEKYLQENKPIEFKNIIQDNPESLKKYFESKGFFVNSYENDEGDTCAELSKHTKGGVEMLITLEPFDKDSFIDYVNDFNVDEEIDFYRRNDNQYFKDFTVRESLEDFEDYAQFLVEILYELK